MSFGGSLRAEPRETLVLLGSCNRATQREPVRDIRVPETQPVLYLKSWQRIRKLDPFSSVRTD